MPHLDGEVLPIERLHLPQGFTLELLGLDPHRHGSAPVGDTLSGHQQGTGRHCAARGPALAVPTPSAGVPESQVLPALPPAAERKGMRGQWTLALSHPLFSRNSPGGAQGQGRASAWPLHMVLISPQCTTGSQPSLATRMRKQARGRKGCPEIQGDAEQRPPLHPPRSCPHPGSASRQQQPQPHEPTWHHSP